jgi:hypothetical protein
MKHIHNIACFSLELSLSSQKWFIFRLTSNYKVLIDVSVFCEYLIFKSKATNAKHPIKRVLIQKIKTLIICLGLSDNFVIRVLINTILIFYLPLLHLIIVFHYILGEGIELI